MEKGPVAASPDAYVAGLDGWRAADRPDGRPALDHDGPARPSGSKPRAWSLTQTRQNGSGVVANTFERTDRPPPTGSCAEIPPGPAELARRERWARGG